MVWTLAILAGAILLGAAYESYSARRDRRELVAPGERLVLDGRTFHAQISGRGSPTVVLEAGLGASSVSWCMVQPLIAEFARVFSYDRAGAGWSDPDPGPATAARFAADLPRLLDAAGLEPPYLFVSHSAGAFTVRLFTAQHPDQVSGLVLVDPIAVEEFTPPSEKRLRRMRGGIKLARRCARLARVGLVRLFLSLVLWTGAERIAGWGFFLGSGRIVDGGERLASAFRQLPSAIPRVLVSLWSRPSFFRSIEAQIEGLRESAEQVRKAPLPSPIPVTVISAAKGGPFSLEHHRAMAAASERGRHVIAERSDHFVLIDEPERIAEEVRAMIAALGPGGAGN